MKMGLKFLKILLFTLLLGSCSLAPMTSPKSAASLGEKKYELSAGLSPALNAGLGIGIKDNLDIGFGYEIQIFSQISTWAKYSFLNNPEGHSFALYGGLFAAADISSSYGFFLGPIYSYRKDWFEHYLVTRINNVHWDVGDINSDDRDDSIFDDIDWGSGSFSYLQFTYGVNFHTSKKFAINLSAQYWYFLGGESGANNIVPGVEFIFKF